MALNAKLVVVGGDVKTTEIKLKLPSTIGRGRGTAIVLPHPLVSRQHCELYEAAGRLMVRDLGSLNGTFVNNQRVTESALEPGELLTVGTVTFRAIYEAEDASAASGKSPKAKGEKTVREDKTVKATKGTTLAAKKEPAPASSDSEVIDFNLEQPLLPPGDGSLNVTQQIDRAPTNQGKKPPAKPAQPAEKEANSSSEDDLKDFLESLEE
jgi:pSer/pThr/pTyr-binding forkhead associated (FHA) protein